MNPNTEYEKFAQEIYQGLVDADVVKTTDVKHNVKLVGKSGQAHQIDVYWEYEIAGVKHKVAIECKNYNKAVPVGKVRDFYGVLSDLNSVAGIMVTTVGYQEGAKEYASHYGVSLKELRVPNWGEAIIGEIQINFDISRRISSHTESTISTLFLGGKFFAFKITSSIIFGTITFSSVSADCITTRFRSFAVMPRFVMIKGRCLLLLMD